MGPRSTGQGRGREQDNVSQSPSPHTSQGITLSLATQLSDLELTEDEDMWWIHLWASKWPQTRTSPIQCPPYPGNRDGPHTADLTSLLEYAKRRQAGLPPSTRDEKIRTPALSPPLSNPNPPPTSIFLTHRPTF